MEIVFATANLNKLREAIEILGDSFSIVTSGSIGISEDIPEDAATIEENAVMKAEYIWKKSRMSCFADDTGLEVAALDGAPGVHSARYASLACDPVKNMDKLLGLLYGCDNRKARFVTIIALIINGETHIFEGVLDGVITCSPRGDGGFGYDPLFVPDGYDKTLAELPAEEKNKISHRGIALRKLAAFLKNED